MKIAALADIHIRETSGGMFNELFMEIGQKANVLLLCGDLTDRGIPSEAKVLCDELRDIHIPVIAVLGNHDFDNDQQDEIIHVLRATGVIVLDKEPYEFEHVGFAGVKGFLGGFDEHELGAFGEDLLKKIVSETDHEAHDLENQLKELKTEQKIVLLHYSPIKETLKGEPEEIYPFLGATRFAQVIDQFGGTRVFHGHAHSGSPEGKTGKGVPVYNVCLQVLTKHARQSFKLIEINGKNS